MNVEVIKFDNLGRGIGYVNDKIIFIPYAVPNDEIVVKVVEEKKNYLIGEIVEIIKPSKLRIPAICPFFGRCGGCDLMQIRISEALFYKVNEMNNILKKNNINYEVKDIIKSENIYNYRNKITFTILNGSVGYFKNDTHELIKIDYCYLAKDAINDLIKDIPLLNILNGKITIRCNYKNELLLIIESTDTIANVNKIVSKHNIVGIILNDNCLYGDDYFIDKVDNYLFKVSYDSFFQVNPYICASLFTQIKKEVSENDLVLDLYSGVGTLSIASSKSQVYGVEIVEDAVKDAKFNANLNGIKNANFECANTLEIREKITNEFDIIILDPPRSGVDKRVLEKIKQENIKKIIYVSCNPQTLVRDLKILENKYEIKKITLLDMFANTHHVESFCVLNLR